MAGNPDVVTVLLGGDVMLGRGVDQILPHPGKPQLRERYMRDATGYVRLAERVNGRIPLPVDWRWPWGEALAVLENTATDVCLINLETTITADGEFADRKPVCYRMHPDNVPALTALRPHVCALANNHILDFGYQGLTDTVAALAGAGIQRGVAVVLPTPGEDHPLAGVDVDDGAGRAMPRSHRPAISATGAQLDTRGDGHPAPKPVGLGDEREGAGRIQGHDDRFLERHGTVSL